MKTTILFLILSGPALGGTLTVCSAGCDYPTAQAALNASNNGDTLVLTAGQNHGSLVIPGNRHDLTIKSSMIDSYPRGYRITRGNPALARLTTVTVGDAATWGTTTPGSSVLTNYLSGAPYPHGLSAGQKVTVGGTRYSAYFCASLNQPPYVDGACDSSRVGFVNIRANTQFTNGTVLYFRGRTLPTPLATQTPYYIVNFVRGGGNACSSYACANADKFQLALSPGGTPIAIPQFNPEGQDLVVEVPPLPKQIGDPMYVVSTPTPTTLQLSSAPGGPPTVWTQIPFGNSGGGFLNGFSLTRTSPVYNITFDGIEVFPMTDRGVYYPFYVSRDIASMEGEHHDIRILRCWLHGADDQEDFPMTVLNIAGRNLEIGWNVIENAYSTGNDTQNIGFLSTGNVSIHDNDIKGAAEGIMSGGNLPWFAFEKNTTGISIYRNYIWKPLKAYIGIAAVYQSPTEFRLLSRFSSSDCSVVAAEPDLGRRCFAYEAQETPGTSTPPSAPVVSRTEWTASAANSTFTVKGTAGQSGYIYLLGGVFHMDYNFSGNVVCPSEIVCARVAVPAFPVLSTRIGIAIIGSGGVFDGYFFGQNRNVWSKNLLESKYGDNWLIEGNVFHRQSNCDGGSTCQDPAIQFTVAANGSGVNEPVNYMVSSSNSIIRNNIFRHLSTGIVAVGKTFPGNFGGTGKNWEFVGFGKNFANRIENNLFMDLGSTEYQAPFNGAPIIEYSTQALVAQHNTAVDVRIGFLMSGVQQSIFRSNILTPYRSACPGYSGCQNPASTSHIGVMDQPGPPVLPYVGSDGSLTWAGNIQNGSVDATSSFDNNLIMNRMGVCCITSRPGPYPLKTWLISPGDAGRDPNTLFQAWQERDNTQPPNGLNYRAGNYRLAAGKAALYPAFDAAAIGADIDQIEALTGKNGIDVENGQPTFAERTARKVSVGGSSAVISYLPNGSSCTISLWTNPAYSGSPVITAHDAGAEIQDGRIKVTLLGLRVRTAHYAKRWCGNEVDVFTLTTANATPALALQLAAPDGALQCVVEYGPTSALGSVTDPSPVSGGNCTVSVPEDAVYWRHTYRSSLATVVGRGDIQRRGM